MPSVVPSPQKKCFLLRVHRTSHLLFGCELKRFSRRSVGFVVVSVVVPFVARDVLAVAAAAVALSSCVAPLACFAGAASLSPHS